MSDFLCFLVSLFIKSAIGICKVIACTAVGMVPGLIMIGVLHYIFDIGIEGTTITILITYIAAILYILQE